MAWELSWNLPGPWPANCSWTSRTMAWRLHRNTPELIWAKKPISLGRWKKTCHGWPLPLKILKPPYNHCTTFRTKRWFDGYGMLWADVNAMVGWCWTMVLPVFVPMAPWLGPHWCGRPLSSKLAPGRANSRWAAWTTGWPTGKNGGQNSWCIILSHGNDGLIDVNSE